MIKSSQTNRILTPLNVALLLLVLVPLFQAVYAQNRRLLVTSYYSSYVWAESTQGIVAGSVGSGTALGTVRPRSIQFALNHSVIVAVGDDDETDTFDDTINVYRSSDLLTYYPQVDKSSVFWNKLSSVEFVGNIGWVANANPTTDTIMQFDVSTSDLLDSPSTPRNTNACPTGEGPLSAVPVNSTHYIVICYYYESGTATSSIHVIRSSDNQRTTLRSVTGDWFGFGSIDANGWFYWPQGYTRRIHRYNVFTGQQQIDFISSVTCNQCSTLGHGVWRVRVMNDSVLYAMLYTANSDANCISRWSTSTGALIGSNFLGAANRCATYMWDFLFLPGYGSFVAPYALPLPDRPGAPTVPPPVATPVSPPVNPPMSPPSLPPTSPPSTPPFTPPPTAPTPVEGQQPPSGSSPVPVASPTQAPVAVPVASPASVPMSSSPVQAPAGPAPVQQQQQPVAVPSTSPVAAAAAPTAATPQVSAPVISRRIRIVFSAAFTAALNAEAFCENAIRRRFSLLQIDFSCSLETFNKRAILQTTNGSITVSFLTAAGLAAFDSLRSDVNLQTELLNSISATTSTDFQGIEIQFDPAPLAARPPQSSAPTASAQQPTTSGQINNGGGGDSGSSPVGIIVGVIGALLAVGILVAIALFLLNRRKKQQKRDLSSKNKNSKSSETGSDRKYDEIELAGGSNDTYSPIKSTLNDDDDDGKTNASGGGKTIASGSAGSWVVSYDDLQFGKRIGHGAFGEVWRGMWRGGDVAIKRAFGISDESFAKEADLMKSLRPHANVTQIYGVCVHEGDAILVMEFLRGGSLDSYLKKREKRNKPLSEEEIVRLAFGIASGMVHLHAEKILHRDLAARNILLSSDREPKIADFGLSHQNTKAEDKDVDGELTIKQDFGPVRWMSPESIAKHIYSVKTDVYAYGITLFEICSMGAIPLADLSVREAALRRRDENLTPELPENTPEIIREICAECWEADPDLRPTFKMIVKKLQKVVDTYSDDDDDVGSPQERGVMTNDD